MIRRLAEKAWIASRKESRIARTVFLKLKTADFHVLTRSQAPHCHQPPAKSSRESRCLCAREWVLIPGRDFGWLVSVLATSVIRSRSQNRPSSPDADITPKTGEGIERKDRRPHTRNPNGDKPSGAHRSALPRTPFLGRETDRRRAVPGRRVPKLLWLANNPPEMWQAWPRELPT
jgi:hypothetical protein